MITLTATTILWAIVGLSLASILAGLSHSFNHSSGSTIPLPGEAGCVWAIASTIVFLLALGCAIGRMI